MLDDSSKTREQLIAELKELREKKEVVSSSEELFKNSQLVDVLFHHSPFGLAINEIDSGKVIFANKAFRAAYRAPAEKCNDVSSFFEYIYGDRMEIGQPILDDIYSGNPERMKWEDVPIIDRESGEIYYVSASNIVLADQNIIISTVRDVTETKKAEEQKLALERQVQHAQKLESLGVLAGGIAHDFNNLLMAILGNTDLAMHQLSPMSPARHNLSEIEKATTRAADLAKQMLAYSGKGKFVIQPIDAAELIEEISHLLEVSISKKAVLKYNFAENLPTFDADATQIRQIIMNLITNASEAIGDRSGVIALSTGAMDCDAAYLASIDKNIQAGLHTDLKEGIYTYFEVADTGCGMDKETLEKIFDPFFTTKFTGRGLGMSAVLGIVRGHNGAIKIYSELKKGTTFKILFPANKLIDSKYPAESQLKSDKRMTGIGTVLIADDEETVCAVGRQMLEVLGFNVITAPDGRDALELFKKHKDEIVCVLLDLTMPHMDGEQTFRELRRIIPDVRVILCSGYNEQDATQRFVGKGLAGFIQKPFNIKTLEKKIFDILPEQPSESID